MKPISILLAVLATFSLSSAAPLIRIETTISGKEVDGEPLILAAPGVVVEDGKEAIIRFGVLEYALTPRILKNGSVQIETVITDRTKKDSKVLAKPKTVVDLGKSAEITTGNLTLTLLPTRLKKEN
ncbi:MAG: hypothetical protein MUF31_08850 [Akkermansiaceae bacterium]|jgi:hypothetical protein|nr:hypothetical protein [Akkermansiaceae bacterium]